jgi:hypothetical protein
MWFHILWQIPVLHSSSESSIGCVTSIQDPYFSVVLVTEATERGVEGNQNQLQNCLGLSFVDASWLHIVTFYKYKFTPAEPQYKVLVYTN